MNKRIAGLLFAALFACGTFSVAAETGEISEAGEAVFTIETGTAESDARREVTYSCTLSLTEESGAVRSGSEAYASGDDAAETEAAGEDRSFEEAGTQDADAGYGPAEEHPEENEDLTEFSADGENDGDGASGEIFEYVDPDHLPAEQTAHPETLEPAESGEADGAVDAPEKGISGEDVETGDPVGGFPEDAGEEENYLIGGEEEDGFLEEDSPIYADDFFWEEDNDLRGDSDSEEDFCYSEEEVDESYGDEPELPETEYTFEEPDAETLEMGGARAE